MNANTQGVGNLSFNAENFVSQKERETTAETIRKETKTRDGRSSDMNERKKLIKNDNELMSYKLYLEKP